MTNSTQELEVGARRRGASLSNNPADGAFLTIGGVMWQIPSRGASVSPSFGSDGVTVLASADDWPEADDLMEATPLTTTQSCPVCGAPIAATIDIEPDDKDFLQALFTLAAKVLRVKYDLSDQQLSSLLKIDGDVFWVAQLLRWAQGIGTELPEIDPDEELVQAELMQYAAEAATQKTWRDKLTFWKR